MQGKSRAMLLGDLGTFHNAGSGLPKQLLDLFDNLALAMFEANVAPLSLAYKRLEHYLSAHPEYLDQSVGGHGTVREFLEEAEQIIDEMLASPAPHERRGGLSGLGEVSATRRAVQMSNAYLQARRRGGLAGLGATNQLDPCESLWRLIDGLADAMVLSDVRLIGTHLAAVTQAVTRRPSLTQCGLPGDPSGADAGFVSEYLRECEATWRALSGAASSRDVRSRPGHSALNGLGAPPWSRGGPPPAERAFLRALQQFARAMKEAAEAMLAADIPRSRRAIDQREEAAEQMVRILRGTSAPARERLLRHISNDRIRDIFRVAANNPTGLNGLSGLDDDGPIDKDDDTSQVEWFRVLYQSFVGYETKALKAQREQSAGSRAQMFSAAEHANEALQNCRAMLQGEPSAATRRKMLDVVAGHHQRLFTQNKGGLNEFSF